MQSSRLWKFGATAAMSIFTLAACSEVADGPTNVPVTEAVFDDHTGNGGPNGKLAYQLNIIGTSDKNPDMTGDNGRRIFVPLDGKIKINLYPGDFGVGDANATDDGVAEFYLPDPDVDGDGYLDGLYSVYARPLGTPGGSANITTCAEFLGDVAGTIKNRGSTLDENAICSLETVELTRYTGKSKFTNVTDKLLTLLIGVDEDGNGTIDFTIRLPLFDDDLQGEFWEYDNNGLRLAQIRFYWN